jgi:predicted GNAT family N-acyltransferase
VSDEPIFGPETLGPHHELDDFDCGIHSLNDYLKRRAASDQAADKSRTYVVCCGNRVVGYFSLAAAGVEARDATGRAAKGQGAQPVPAILIGRLAVDIAERGRGIGRELLIETLVKSAHAADTIGARVVLVHAVNEHARAFYLRYGFEPSPTDPLHLMMLMKDIRRSL